jgi:hypothetical protein
MSEQFPSPESTKETVEHKKERLMPIFSRSLEVMENTELDLEEGILVVTRERADGTREKITDLMVMEITEDGPNLAFIDSDGNPSNSATLLWREIIDAKRQIIDPPPSYLVG